VHLQPPTRAVPDMPAQIIEGASFAETRHLAVKVLVPYLKVLVAAKLTELKAIGAAPRGTRVHVSYDGPAYCASLNVRITAPREWAHSAGVLREVEALRQSFNRQVRNTSADRCRYYGATTITIGA
jgi:hypothetical protein